MAIDLNKVGEQIKKFFEADMSDEDIAGKVNLPVQQVIGLRNILGLKRRAWANVFEKTKRLMKDKYHEAFVVQFRIPVDKMKEIGLDWDDDYEFTVDSSKMKLNVTFMERHEL
jgi:hypothetical protein